MHNLVLTSSQWKRLSTLEVLKAFTIRSFKYEVGFYFIKLKLN
jgi:hypothetical protein